MEPSQVCRFPGLDIDSRDMTFNISADKLEKVKVKLQAVRASGTCRVREVAQLVGTL